MSIYWVKHALGFKLGGWLLIPSKPTNAEKSDHQWWWILFELWRCPITCIWLCSCVYCYAPFTGTTTGPIGYTPGVIAGVAVGCLSLSLLLTAATGVITFLCTRRCYNKKSSPPSPNEKSVYYETVQSDSVQMQPSPAYQSVEKVKWTCCVCTCKFSCLTIAYSNVSCKCCAFMKHVWSICFYF